MKQDQIRTGGLYQAKVGDQIETVRVDKINYVLAYRITVLRTGKKLSFKSAAKFRCEAQQEVSEEPHFEKLEEGRESTEPRPDGPQLSATTTDSSDSTATDHQEDEQSADPTDAPMHRPPAAST